MKKVTFILLFCSNQVFAQDLSFLMDNAPTTNIEADGLYAPEQDFENDSDNSKVLFSRLQASHAFRKEQSTWIVGGRSEKLDLSSQNPSLDDYYSYQLSLSYRRRQDDGKFWSLNGSYGTASDRPFKNSEDSTVGLTYIQKFSPRWFGVVNYSNNRAFLNNIPLPGFFWVKELSKEKTLVVGFPFIVWVTPISQNWSFRYLGILPWHHRLRLVYDAKWVNPFVGLEQSPQNFFRHDREKQRERFFWFERRVGAGLEGRLGPHYRYELFNGLAFDRQFFEAKNFSESKQELNNLENSYFVSLNLKISF